MATIYSFSGQIVATISGTMTHATNSDGSGSNAFSVTLDQALTDGTGDDQGTLPLKGSLTVGTGTVTMSLADSADPFSTAGDAVPLVDPEDKELLGIIVKNTHATGIITLTATASTGVKGLFAALGDGILVGPNDGIFLWYSPGGNEATGGSKLNDASDDELNIVSDTANTTVDICILYQ